MLANTMRVPLRHLIDNLSSTFFSAYFRFRAAACEAHVTTVEYNWGTTAQIHTVTKVRQCCLPDLY
jgi:hypothetical protein